MTVLTSEKEFYELIHSPIALVLFKTYGCSVCHAVGDQLDQRLVAYPDLPYASIYADDFPKLRGEHMIFTAPVVLLFVNGKEVFRSAQFIDFSKLMNTLDIYFS